MSENVLLYLHLPKTAGSAVTEVFKSQFPDGKTATIGPPDYIGAERALFERKNTGNEDISFVYGHFSYGLHEAFLQPAHYYTILRHPIDRLVSLYYFTRSTPSHPRHDLANKLSLVDYALSGAHPEIENCQTKMLSGRRACNFIDGYERCTDHDLVLAKQHLVESFIGIGVYEHLDLSMSMLQRSLGWPVKRIPKRNVTRQRRSLSDLSPEELVALTRVNQFDLKLYDFALDLFRREVKALPWRTRLGFAMADGRS